MHDLPVSTEFFPYGKFHKNRRRNYKLIEALANNLDMISWPTDALVA